MSVARRRPATQSGTLLPAPHLSDVKDCAAPFPGETNARAARHSIFEMPSSIELAEPFLTAQAFARLLGLARLIAPHAVDLQQRYARVLTRGGWRTLRRKALLEISPVSAARMLAARKPLHRFLEQVEYNSRRLAKLNVTPGEALEALSLCDPLVARIAGGRFEPAREQLRLATVLSLNRAFYAVRDAEAQALFQLVLAESEAGNIDELLERFAGVLVETLRARAGVVSLMPEGVPKALRRPRFLAGSAAAGLILDRRLARCGQSWWTCPAGDGAVIQLAFSGNYRWLPRELDLIRAAAARCRRAMERVGLQAALADRERQVVHLAAAARRAEEDERRRIGRELHDETGQSLLVLRLQLELLGRDSPPELVPRLAELRTSVERNIAELRRTIAALSPDVLERLGLQAALRHLAARFEKSASLPVRVRLSRAGETTGEAAQVVYRVAQEALQNIARHARASHVNLSFQVADKTVRLIVADDGIGFDAEAVMKKPLSFGLAGMRERALLAGGRLGIRSAPGSGTAIHLELPRPSARKASYGKNSSTSD